MTVSTTRIGSEYEFESDQEDWHQQLELIYARQFLTAEECRLLISLQEFIPMADGRIGPDSASTVNTDVRKVKTLPLHALGKKIEWLSSRLQSAIENFNNDFYRFDLKGFDGITLLNYDAQNSKYDQHTDIISEDSYIRKLSVIIQLSEPTDYQGGKLEIIDGSQVIPGHSELGSINVFPSFLNHRVTPITMGQRYAIVTWAIGPPFI